MFLFIYSIPIMLSHLCSLNILLTFRVFIFFISFTSLSICYTLIKKIFSPENATLAGLFLITLAIIFILFPLPNDFGQREHLLLILIMPYLLLTSYRMQHKSVSLFLAVVIGFIAGIGFAIKPFFCVTFFLVECYYAFRKKTLAELARPESTIIIGLLGIYILLIYAFFHNYLTIILPSTARFYYLNYHTNWKIVLLNPLMFFCGISVLCYLVRNKKNRQQQLGNILLIALIGLLSSYLLHNTGWYYQLYPAYAISTLLLVITFGSFLLQSRASHHEYVAISLLSLLFYLFLFYDARPIPAILFFSPNVFFCFFAILFSCLLYLFLPVKNFFHTIVSVMVTISLSMLCGYISQHEYWPYYYRFYFIVSTLVALFILFIPRIGKLHSVVTTLFAILAFAFPCYFQYVNYLSGTDLKTSLEKIFIFMNSYAQNKPVYFFTTALEYEFPAIHYANAIPASKYPDLRWLPAIMKTHSEKDKDDLVTTVANELNITHPKFVFVDVKKNKDHYENIKIDYINDFSKYAIFKEAWKPYRYFTTIDNLPFYKLHVYQRIQ